METSSVDLPNDDVTREWLNRSQDGTIADIKSLSKWSQDRCPVFEFVISTIVIGFACITGIVLNTISFAVLNRDRNNEVATFLLKTLSLADNSVLLVSLVMLSFFFGPYQFPTAQNVLISAMPFMRIIVHPLGYIAHSCSIWMTVLLAINRFVAVCYPFLSERYLTLKLARIQVAVVVMFSTLVNLPRFFMYAFTTDHEPVSTSAANGSNSPLIWYKPTSLLENSPFNLYYINIFYSSIVLILPLIILIIFNFAIVHTIKKSTSRMRQNSVSLRGAKQERSLTVVMIVIIVELVLCHSLDRVLLILKHVMSPSAVVCPNSLNFASHVSNLLIITNSATDFFIYVIFKKRFRKLLRKMCRGMICCRGKNRMFMRPSSCSQMSNDASGKVGCLKQMELISGQYKQLATSISFRNDRSPSDSVFIPIKGTPLYFNKSNSNGHL